MNDPDHRVLVYRTADAIPALETEIEMDVDVDAWLLVHEGHSWAVSGSISQLTGTLAGKEKGIGNGNGNGNTCVWVDGEINIWMRVNCRQVIGHSAGATDSSDSPRITMALWPGVDFAHLARLCNRRAQGHWECGQVLAVCLAGRFADPPTDRHQMSKAVSANANIRILPSHRSSESRWIEPVKWNRNHPTLANSTAPGHQSNAEDVPVRQCAN